MKKLLTFDSFMVAFVSALGYGYGETIAYAFGWPDLVCLAVCIAVGVTAEGIISKVIYSEAVQTSKSRRTLIYIGVFLLFLAGHYLSTVYMNVSMLDYLAEEFMWVIGLPLLGFAINMLIRGIRVHMIHRRYGDGNDGYVIDVSDKDVAETNQQNVEITGAYDAACAVSTKTGTYVGVKDGKVFYYLGIPYAKPPVGELRWKAPEPLSASQAVYEARHFGASAIQVEHSGSVLNRHRQSEDCLYLNICTGTEKTDAKKPVLVLFHHGDFCSGGSVDPLLYGANFVKAHQDIVFVSFNYRLGILGFIDFSDIPGHDAYPDALNLGLLDQVAALTWIQENIGAFGGDPDRITVLGFESGATSICLLAASQKAQGLFHRAFVFNGSPGAAYDTPEHAKLLAQDLLRETNSATMDDLAQLSTEALKDATQRLWPFMCAPTCDGSWIPTDVYRAYQDGATSGIEFIVGLTNNETQTYRSLVGTAKFESILAASIADARNSVDEETRRSLDEYLEKLKKSSSEVEAQAKLVDQWHTLSTYRSAAKLSEGGSAVHLLYWGEKPLIENLGSGTIDVAAVLLGNVDALQMYGSVMNDDVSEILQAFLAKFANGSPLRLYHNEVYGVDALTWDAYPQALIAADNKLVCNTIEDKVLDVKDLLDFMLR